MLVYPFPLFYCNTTQFQLLLSLSSSGNWSLLQMTQENSILNPHSYPPNPFLSLNTKQSIQVAYLSVFSPPLIHCLPARSSHFRVGPRSSPSCPLSPAACSPLLFSSLIQSTFEMFSYWAMHHFQGTFSYPVIITLHFIFPESSVFLENYLVFAD